MKKVLVFLLISMSSLHVFSQDTIHLNSNPPVNRPTIGLVLSGGGAKGFAHIGVIKLLEEVGIVPDYITGTSMGSIVGGLYSMGYSVEEMEMISDTTDWDMVLSNNVALTEVTVAEKPYYGTFLTEMNVTKSGVSLPGGLIEGQNLLEYLSVLTRPVHGVEDFTQFPIPFTCVATDIVNGKPVALNKGKITNAIRASMAIPTAFTPVEYDSLLLIDGGWTRNLPVQEAKDMGADIIISVDVGAPLKEKDELQSMISILDQTAWLLSVQDTEKQKEMSDYVVHPPVGNFSTFDFASAKLIIHEGYQEAEKYREEFEALAKRIYPNGKNEKAVVKPNYKDQYYISNVEVHGTKLTSKKFVSGRLQIKEDKPISATEVSRKMGLLYGSMYYQKVGFELVPNQDSTHTLHVNVVEDNPIKLKVSLYYDTENSIGINLNATLRNVLLKDSRLIFDAFLSENPILGLKYLKYLGPDQKAFAFGDFFYTRDSRYEWLNLYDQPATYNYRELIGAAGLAYTVNNRLLMAGSVGYVSARMTPKTNPDTIVDRWSQSQFPLRLTLTYNTFDRAVFPTRGMKIHAFTAYNLNISHTARLREDYEGVTQEEVDNLIGLDPFFMFRATIQGYVPLGKKFSLYGDARLEFGSDGQIGFNEYSKVGGIAPILVSGVPFWGLTRNEVNITQLGMASVGFQWNFWGSLFLKGKVNYLNSQYPMDLFFAGERKEQFSLYGNTYTSIFGFGGEIAYNSPLGPIRLVLHQNQYSSTLHGFVAIGYNIYKSDGAF